MGVHLGSGRPFRLRSLPRSERARKARLDGGQEPAPISFRRFLASKPKSLACIDKTWMRAFGKWPLPGFEVRPRKNRRRQAIILRSRRRLLILSQVCAHACREVFSGSGNAQELRQRWQPCCGEHRQTYPDQAAATSDVRRGLSIPCELPPSPTMLLPLRIEHARREAPAPVTQKAQHRQRLAAHARRLK